MWVELTCITDAVARSIRSIRPALLNACYGEPDNLLCATHLLTSPRALSDSIHSADRVPLAVAAGLVALGEGFPVGLQASGAAEFLSLGSSVQSGFIPASRTCPSPI